MKKYCIKTRIFLLSFILFFNNAFCSLPKDFFDGNWPEGKLRPHVVFDIDDTLCVKVDLNKRLETHKLYPEATLIPFYSVEDGLFIHVFFPEIGELLLSILGWGWNIDFFSAGAANRNTSVIPNFLKVVLSAYFENPEVMVDTLMKNRIRIFSKEHLVASKDWQKGYDFHLIASDKKVEAVGYDTDYYVPSIVRVREEDESYAHQVIIHCLENETEPVKEDQETELFAEEIRSTERLRRVRMLTPSDEVVEYIQEAFENIPPMETHYFFPLEHPFSQYLDLMGGKSSTHPMYETWGNNKKDLRRLEVPLTHVLLVEDDSTYAVGGEQFPPLLVGSTLSYNFEGHIRHGQHPKHENNASLNAPFLLGALSGCKKIMEETDIPLREALKKLRKIPRSILENYRWFDPEKEYSPWSVACPSRYRQLFHEKDRYEYEKAMAFVTSGRLLLNELKTKRIGKIQSESAEDPFESLTRQLYGNIELKNGKDGCVVM